METSRIVGAGVAIALVLVYMVGSAVWVGSGREFYLSLDRPPWQPPSFVIGLIWPYNFAVLGVSGVVVALRGSAAAVIGWLVLNAASIVAALAWARLFFFSEALWPAAVALVLSAALTVPLVIIAWRVTWWSGALLVPYTLWVATAASLAVGYAVRNPPA